MGEQADMMIDGSSCESCGEHIGEATGYPRKCRGCSPNKGRTTSEAWDYLKAYDPYRFTEFHWGLKGELDIWPTKYKYHHLPTGKRGTFTSYSALLDEFFPPEKTQERQMDVKTLRDEFAMAAMQGILAFDTYNDWPTASMAAEKAYEYADAMLKARTQEGEIN
jgi:hypothetical protein